jgi:hypothetical protein
MNQPLEDKLIYPHFLIAGSDWYVAEFDGKDLFWGFVILGGDYLNAEWSYIPFNELKEIKIRGLFEVETDTHWRIRPAWEVDKIIKCHPHWKRQEIPTEINFNKGGD